MEYDIVFVHELSELNGAIDSIQVSGVYTYVCVFVCSYSLSFTLTVSLSAIIVRLSPLTCRWMRISQSVCGAL